MTDQLLPHPPDQRQKPGILQLRPYRLLSPSSSPPPPPREGLAQQVQSWIGTCYTIIGKSTILFLFKQNDTKLGEKNLSDLNPSPQEENGSLCSYACTMVKNFKKLKVSHRWHKLVNVHLRAHHARIIAMGPPSPTVFISQSRGPASSCSNSRQASFSSSKAAWPVCL